MLTTILLAVTLGAGAPVDGPVDGGSTYYVAQGGTADKGGSIVGTKVGKGSSVPVSLCYSESDRQRECIDYSASGSKFWFQGVGVDMENFIAWRTAGLTFA